MQIGHLTWQMHDANEWVFGLLVRGVVRNPVAEIYYDEDQNPSWIWLTHIPGHPRGAYDSFQLAVEQAEKAVAAVDAAKAID